MVRLTPETYNRIQVANGLKTYLNDLNLGFAADRMFCFLFEQMMPSKRTSEFPKLLNISVKALADAHLFPPRQARYALSQLRQAELIKMIHVKEFDHYGRLHFDKSCIDISPTLELYFLLKQEAKAENRFTQN